MQTSEKFLLKLKNISNNYLNRFELKIIAIILFFIGTFIFIIFGIILERQAQDLCWRYGYQMSEIKGLDLKNAECFNYPKKIKIKDINKQL